MLYPVLLNFHLTPSPELRVNLHREITDHQTRQNCLKQVVTLLVFVLGLGHPQDLEQLYLSCLLFEEWMSDYKATTLILSKSESLLCSQAHRHQ